MQPYASWWSVDPDGATAVSPETKQQIRHIGKAADDTELRLVSSQHRFWMRFEYEDAECKYPLLVEWQNERRGGTQRWRVDHIRSAALWRREAASAAANPAYGLWRRADDAITQALTRWPATAAIGPTPSGVCLDGGWHNGSRSRHSSIQATATVGGCQNGRSPASRSRYRSASPSGAVLSADSIRPSSPYPRICRHRSRSAD